MARPFIGFLGDWVRPVDEAARDAILDAERTRVGAWAKTAKLAERGIEVDSGCEGTVPEGVQLTFREAGFAEQLVCLTDARRTDHVLDALFDDLTLSGSLRSIAVTPDAIILRFVPLRATEVYDVALRRLDEILTAARAVPRIEQGPYR